MLHYYINKKGFTLAEVLITLGIIGVVASVTMPLLVANYQEKVAITRLKKVYSLLSQVYTQATNDYGYPDEWPLINPEDSISPQVYSSYSILKDYIKSIKICSASECKNEGGV